MFWMIPFWLSSAQETESAAKYRSKETALGFLPRSMVSRAGMSGKAALLVVRPNTSSLMAPMVR